MIKIKEIRAAQDYKGHIILYALGEDGLIYFIEHDPENNEATWKQIPTPKTN